MGECRRLIVTAPPRHGKSELVSRRLPPYFLGVHPDREVIATAYGQDLVNDFGRDVRTVVASDAYRALFPGTRLATDAGAIDRWRVAERRGGYVAAGVGGAITGRGADLLIIDDPVKSRAQAESETERNSMWSWYRSVAYTRLMPGASIVLTLCMVGDTAVTMADGSKRNLRDIRPGDIIATYDDGALSTTVVECCADQGEDNIFELRTNDGGCARANARHPFLVDRGGIATWVRLRDIQIGDMIIRCHTERIAVRRAVNMAAVRKPSADGVVSAITTNGSGLLATDLHHITTGLITTQSLNINTGSLNPSTTRYLNLRAAYALSANDLRGPDRRRIGSRSSASITITTQEQCADFCATIATLPSVIVDRQKYSKQRLGTSDFMESRVVSVKSAGRARVFDIQVARTGNFIADGFVSHNTRWHEDDLAGKILASSRAQAWEVLHFPAVSDGAALWPERYPLVPTPGFESLEEIRETIGAYEWSALYEGRPRPLEGGYYQERDLLIELQGQGFVAPAERTLAPVESVRNVTLVFAVIDAAEKSGDSHDGLGVVYCAYSQHFDANMPEDDPRREGRSSLTILDWDYTQIDAAYLVDWVPQVFARLETLAAETRALRGSAGALVEDKAGGIVLLQQAANRGWPARPIDSKLTSLSKVERALNASPYVKGGQVKIRRAAHGKAVSYKGRTRNHLVSQVLDFRPTTRDQGQDDLLDCFSYAVALGLGGAAGF